MKENKESVKKMCQSLSLQENNTLTIDLCRLTVNRQK